MVNDLEINESIVHIKRVTDPQLKQTLELYEKNDNDKFAILAKFKQFSESG